MQLVRFPCTHHMKKEALCTAPPMVNTTPPITMVSFLPIKSEIAEKKKIAEPYILTSTWQQTPVYTCFTGTQTIPETSTCYTETRTLLKTSTCYTETQTILETSTCYTETRTLLETSSLSAKERRAGKYKEVSGSLKAAGPKITTSPSWWIWGHAAPEKSAKKFNYLLRGISFLAGLQVVGFNAQTDILPAPRAPTRHPREKVETIRP